MASAQGKDQSRQTSSALLNLEGVTLRYQTPSRDITATYRISFCVKQSERFVMLGPSGCGKSSLLKAVGGYMKPTEGTIEINGRPVSEPGPDRMMVFQEFDQLLPWRTVVQNVMFPMVHSRKYSRAEARERAHRYLELVQLKDFANVFPHMLSGGMKQRVAIARGMAMEPAVLLMDEPYAALDAMTRRQMQQELLQLWHDVKVTLLFVTHSIQEAVALGTRILLLSPHPGRVRQEMSGLEEGASDAEMVGLERNIHEMLFPGTAQAQS
jgi:NitT/TauT family transport system ATP-binding protein